MPVKSMMRYTITAAWLAALFAAHPVSAQQNLTAVATFSILADLVKNVGGDRVAVATLVEANGNAHAYVPSPADAKKVAAAKIVFVNGLGFEGWIDRLVNAAGTKAPIIIASKGVKPRERADDRDHGHDHGRADPHAWQSVANAKIYVANIRDGLVGVDPAGKAAYEGNATAYIARLDALDREVKETLAGIPVERRRVITSHNAFGYFQDAYGVGFSALQGMSSDAEPSARDVAAIIAEIRRQRASAVFFENVTDPRLMNQIASETGAKIGGTLYSDALTDEKGDATSYIELIRHNLRQLAAAMAN